GFINRWLYKRIGEKPVYQSDVKPFEVEDILRNRLENHGFFYSTTASTFQEKDIEASVTYTLKVPKPYTLARYQLDSMPSPVYQDVQRASKNTSLIEGVHFNLEQLKIERQRIDTQLKKIEYYNLNTDFFIFESNTTQYKDKRFELFLKLKEKVPSKAI